MIISRGTVFQGGLLWVAAPSCSYLCVSFYVRLCVNRVQDDGGNLISTMTFNHEVVRSIKINVTVVDPEGLNDTETLTVLIADVNDPPTISVPPLNVSENRPAGTTVAGRVTAYDEDEAYLATQGFTPRLRFDLNSNDPNLVGQLPFSIHPVCAATACT